jgi:hypothetical protein
VLQRQDLLNCILDHLFFLSEFFSLVILILVILDLPFYFSNLVVKSDANFLLKPYGLIISLVGSSWCVSGKRVSFLNPVYLSAFYLLYWDQNFYLLLCHLRQMILRLSFLKLLGGYKNRFWNIRRHLPVVLLWLMLLNTRFRVPNIVNQRCAFAVNLARKCIARNELRSKAL